MAITLTSPPGDVVWSGVARGGTALVESTGIEVWVIRSRTQERIARVPHEAILGLSYDETLEALPNSSATLVVDRYALLDEEDPDSWLTHELERVVREIQIVHDGRVVHHGPIVSASRVPGEPQSQVQVAGAEYWWGTRLLRGEVEVFGVEQIRTQRIFDPPLDLSGTVRAWEIPTAFRRADWRFVAEVKVAETVPDGETIFFAEIYGGNEYPALKSKVMASNLTRGEWATAVIHMSVETAGAGIGRTLRLEVGGGTDPGDVEFREISAQVSPTSVGLDEEEEEFVPWWTAEESWLMIVGHLGDLDFAGWVEPGLPRGPVGWRRPDVYVSEAARQITENGHGEVDIVLTPNLRLARLVALRGSEHTAVSLTLDNDTVVAWGGWQSGVDRPVSEWIFANDEGFTGSYFDDEIFDGLRLQAFEAAPTGSHAGGLSTRARHAAERAKGALSEQLAATVPMSLVSTLLLGDRVWVDMDDGPDRYEGWMRVQSRSVNPVDAGFGVTLSPWVVE